MSIQTELDRIITAIGAAYDAVKAKGGTDPRRACRRDQRDSIWQRQGRAGKNR